MSKYYNSVFNKLLLEFADSPNDSNTYPDGQSSFEGTLDDGTNPEDFLTKGIQDTFDAVKEHFNSKMQDFADTLSPEKIKGMSLNELKEKIAAVYKFTSKVQVFSKSKIDQLSSEPYAIMAALVASDPTKQSTFEDLHSNLEDVQTAFEDTEGFLNGLKSKIDDFISDIAKADQTDLERLHSKMQSSLPKNGQPESAPQRPSNMNI